MNATDRLPERVQMLVDALGSQRALARLVGVSDGTVIGWLEGATPYPRTLKKIANATGLSFAWLREGKGDESARLAALRAQSEQSAATSLREDPPIYGAPGSAQTIHDAIRFITERGTLDDVRMLEDILTATRRRIEDRRRGS